jgi:hypothetical protein
VKQLTLAASRDGAGGFVTGAEPVYPKTRERMLRIYFLQQWFNLSDPAVEEARYDSAAMRGFVGIDLGREPVPDETTMCRFRHLLEAKPTIWARGCLTRASDT